ncbi:hypothetical protein KIPB_011600, partial [Kipferlia bialata]
EYVHRTLVESGLLEPLLDTACMYPGEVEIPTLVILNDLVGTESVRASVCTTRVIEFCVDAMRDEAAPPIILDFAVQLWTVIKAYRESVGLSMPVTLPLDILSVAKCHLEASVKDASNLARPMMLMFSVLKNPELKDPAVSLGIHKLVVKLLATHRHSQDLTYYGTGVLELLTVYKGGPGAAGSEAMHQQLIDSGVLSTCRTAMLAFPASSGIAHNVVTTLSVLCHSDACHARLVSHGVHKWALELMSQHVQGWTIVRAAATIILALHEKNRPESLTDFHDLRPTVTEFLMKRSSLNTLVAAMNLHMDVGSDTFGFGASGTIMCTLQILLTKPDLYPRLQELHIPELVSRYAKSSPNEEDASLVDILQSTAQESGAQHVLDQCRAYSEAKAAKAVSLADSEMEDLIKDHLTYGKVMGGVRGKPYTLPPRTLPPLCARVLYLPDQGQKWLDGFCARFQQCGLSVLNVMGCKNPSALKRQLARLPQLIVCTHHTSQAKAGSK